MAIRTLWTRLLLKLRTTSAMPNTPFDTAKSHIPPELLERSGKVFYSGRSAFSRPASLYVLGVNPGGDPGAQAEETLASHTDWVASSAPDNWSAYRDESWKGKSPGRHGMQPRILHMFNALGLNPGEVPASNLVFVRSRREGDLSGEVDRLVQLCWPFHELVISALRPKVILCLGRTAGEHVCRHTGASDHYASFTELNDRKWQSHAYRSRSGLRVVVATHPSIADWKALPTDPTGLLADALRAA